MTKQSFEAADGKAGVREHILELLEGVFVGDSYCHVLSTSSLEEGVSEQAHEGLQAHHV